MTAAHKTQGPAGSGSASRQSAPHPCRGRAPARPCQALSGHRMRDDPKGALPAGCRLRALHRSGDVTSICLSTTWCKWVTVRIRTGGPPLPPRESGSWPTVGPRDGVPGRGSAAVLTVFLSARRGSGFGPACSLTTVSIGLSGRAVRVLGDRALAPSQAHRPMWPRRLIGLPGGCEPPTPGPGKKIHGSAH
jgi:hypothetical protein